MEWLLALDPEFFKQFLNDAAQSQVATFTVAFGLAAWIHSGRVKKEIASQLSGITLALGNVAEALKQDLASQSKRITLVEEKQEEIEKLINQKFKGG